MEPISDTDYGSQTTGKPQKNSSASQGKAGGSAPKSKGRSRSGKGKGATKAAASRPAGSEVGLSILQAGFDQALEEGLRAKLGHLEADKEKPCRILIEVWNAIICSNCQAWTTQTTCPACGTQIG